MPPAAKNLGYDDTPMLPGTPWHVHDGKRPQPPVVNPDPVPSDAVVLFDGTDLSGWVSGDGSAAGWKVRDGYMEVAPGTGNIRTVEEFGDCQLHLEWAAPAVVKGESQGRGNSGVFLMGRYEIQVLDCYNNLTYPDGTTGAIYGQFPPLANPCRKPGEWQTYDIIWEAPQFEGTSVVKPAYVTVLLNGVVLHHRTELRGVTNHRVVTTYEPHPPVGPLVLQDHGDLVRFRNIWYRPLKGYDEG
jgi:3-keto-disaccharide hydrolase